MPSFRLRSLPPLLAAVLLLVPLPLMSLSAGAAPDPNKSQELREAIEGASAEEVLAFQQYQDARAKRLELDSKVAALDAQLSAASATLRAAEAEVAKIQTKIDAAQLEVDRIQAEIDKSKDLFHQSAVDIYKNGGASSLPLLTSTGSAHELISESKYNSENSRRLERELLRQGGLRDALADARDDLKKEGAKAEEAEKVAQSERDRVGGLRADTDAQRQQAASAEQQEQDVLASARAKKAQYESELAAEQARIQASLSPGGSAGLSSGGGSGEVAWPLRGPVSSGFGPRQDPFGNGVRMHTGIDIVASSGTPIAAARAGTVVSAGWNGGYGNAVIIDHGDGLATLYGHQSKIASSGGQKVSQGEVIGYVGSTGNSTGPHLHFEVRVNGAPQDPMRYLP